MSRRYRERQTQQLKRKLEGIEPPDDLEGKYAEYWDDPVAFVEEILEADPQDYQRAVLRDCAEEDRVAWRAAHGVGKTATLSWVLLWWLLTRPFSKVLVVAPAFQRQVGRYLLPEVRKWVRRSSEDLPVEVRAETVEIQGHEREWFATGIQASDPSKVEGGHSEHMAVLADEAKGLDRDVVAALHGTQTDVGGDRLYLLTSVPGGPSGPFYDVFRKGRDLWSLHHTSAEDSDLVSDEWVNEREAEWGKGSPLFTARVLGEFPESSEWQVFSLQDLERAVGKELPDPDDDEERRVQVGVDVARHGNDRSVAAVWKGKRLARLETRQGQGTMETASWVASIANRAGADEICCDVVGIGAGVVDRLYQLGGHNVREINPGSRPSDPDLYNDLRSEMAWRFREALEEGTVSLPDRQELLAELSAIEYDVTSNGRIKLEGKAATKKRVGRSPDLADAAMYGFPAESRRILFYCDGEAVYA